LATSICQMYEYRKECEMIKNIHSALKKNDGDEMAKLYNQIANSSEGSLYIARGKFVYTQKCIEREHSVSSIPMEYRMLFPHRYYANKTRYKSTYLLIVVIFALVAPDFYNITVKVAMILVFLAILLYFVGLYLLLPQLNKRLVCQECKEIEKEESDEQSIVI